MILEQYLIQHITAWINNPDDSAARSRINAFVDVNYGHSNSAIQIIASNDDDAKDKFILQLRQYLSSRKGKDINENHPHRENLQLFIKETFERRKLLHERRKLLHDIKTTVTSWKANLDDLNNSEWLQHTFDEVLNDQRFDLESKQKKALILYSLVLLAQVHYHYSISNLQFELAVWLKSALEAELRKFSVMHSKDPNRQISVEELRPFCIHAWNLNRMEILHGITILGLRLPDDPQFLSFLMPPFNAQKPELIPEHKAIITALVNSPLMLPLPPLASTIVNNILPVVEVQVKDSKALVNNVTDMPLAALSESVSASDSILRTAAPLTLTEVETIITKKPPKPRVEKPAAPPPPPLTAEQQEQKDFKEAIQKANPTIFNEILARNPIILDTAIDFLSLKLVENSKKKDELGNFFSAIDIPLDACFKLYRHRNLSKAQSNVAKAAQKILILKICSYDDIEFINSNEHDIYDTIFADLKNIADSKLKEKFRKKIITKGALLAETLKKYQDAIIKAPHDLARIKADFSISNSKSFKTAMQSQSLAENHLWQKISSINPNVPLDPETYQLIAALHSEIFAYEVHMPTKPYAATIFALAEKTGSARLLAAIVADFRSVFDQVIHDNPLVVHHWLENSSFECFNVLLRLLNPIQRKDRISLALDKNTPLYKAIFLRLQDDAWSDRINLLLENGANHEPFMTYRNKNGNSIINLYLAHGLDEECSKLLDHQAADLSNINKDGDTALHYWAAGYLRNIDLFEKLYKLVIRHGFSISRKVNNKQNTFLHSLLKNTDANQFYCMQVFSVIFAAFEGAVGHKDELPDDYLQFIKTLLLTENQNGESLYSLAETRDWFGLTHAIASYTTMLFDKMLLKTGSISNEDYLRCASIIDRVSKDSIIFRKFDSKEYSSLANYVDLRHNLRLSIEGTSGKSSDPIEEFVLNPYLSHIIHGKSLFRHIFSYERDDELEIESIRTSPSLQSLIRITATNTLDQWLEIQSLADKKTTITPEIESKIKQFAAMLKKYGFDTSVTCPTGDTIADNLGNIGNPALTIAVCENLPVVITPFSLFNLLTASNYNRENLQFIMNKYNNEREKHGFAAFNCLKTTTHFTLLDHAIFKGKNCDRVQELVKILEKFDPDLIPDANLTIGRILVNIEAGHISWEEAYNCIKVLIQHPFFKAQLSRSADGTHAICIQIVFSSEVKTPEEQTAMHKIINLLLDNGSDITEVDHLNQNVFHFAAAAGASKATINLLLERVKTDCPVGTLNTLLSQKSSENKIPMQLVQDNGNPNADNKQIKNLLDPNLIAETKAVNRSSTRLVM